MNKKESLSLGIFLVSIFLIGFIFFSAMNTNITIQLEGGKSIESNISPTYSLLNTIVLMILTISASVSFIYFTSDLSKKISLSKKQKLTTNLLTGQEKELYMFVLEKGECLQKDLVYELKFGKAKVTRILDKLEQKGIIVRISYGKTNKIVAKE